ncbi:MAG: hypothetical protein ACPL3P_09305, partial [Anaerolineales bacterium]
MDIQFCPICGRPNPSDAEECQFCHAALHPAGGTETEKPALPDSYEIDNEPIEPELEVPEWLKDLRSVNPQNDSGESEEEIFEENEELPQWLRFLEERKGEPSEESLQDVHFEPSEESQSLPETEIPQQPSSEISHNFEKEKVPFEAEKEPWTESELPDWLLNMPGEEWQEEEPEEEDFFGGFPPPFVTLDEDIIEQELSQSLQSDATTSAQAETTPSAAENFGNEKPETTEPSFFSEISEMEKGSHPQDRIEVAGPLSGLSDILPAEPFIAQEKNGLDIFANLLVTEKQKQQAELFQQLIAQENV